MDDKKNHIRDNITSIPFAEIVRAVLVVRDKVCLCVYK